LVSASRRAKAVQEYEIASRATDGNLEIGSGFRSPVALGVSSRAGSIAPSACAPKKRVLCTALGRAGQRPPRSPHPLAKPSVDLAQEGGQQAGRAPPIRAACSTRHTGGRWLIRIVKSDSRSEACRTYPAQSAPERSSRGFVAAPSCRGRTALRKSPAFWFRRGWSGLLPQKQASRHSRM
jgi:hypothetical protein